MAAPGQSPTTPGSSPASPGHPGSFPDTEGAPVPARDSSGKFSSWPTDLLIAFAILLLILALSGAGAV